MIAIGAAATQRIVNIVACQVMIARASQADIWYRTLFKAHLSLMYDVSVHDVLESSSRQCGPSEEFDASSFLLTEDLSLVTFDKHV